MLHKFKFTQYLHSAIRKGNVELVKFYLDKGASLTETIKDKNMAQVAIKVLDKCFGEPALEKSRLDIAKAIIDATSKNDFQNENDTAKIGLLLINLIIIGAFDLADECIKPNVDLDWFISNTSDNDNDNDNDEYSDEEFFDDDQSNSADDKSKRSITRTYTWDFLIKAKQYKVLEHLITTHLTHPMYDDQGFLDTLMASADASNDVTAAQLIIDLSNKFSEESDVLEKSKQIPETSSVTVSDKPQSFFDSAQTSMLNSTAIVPTLSNQ